MGYVQLCVYLYLVICTIILEICFIYFFYTTLTSMSLLPSAINSISLRLISIK